MLRYSRTAQQWFRPHVSVPYGLGIHGPQLTIDQLRIQHEEYATADMYEKTPQFKPSKVGKLLTGPKNTGKTFLNTVVLRPIPHLSVNFRGRVKCTADIVAAMDVAFHANHMSSGRLAEVAAIAKKIRSASGATMLGLRFSGLEMPAWVDEYLKSAWTAANATCVATEKLGIKDPIERWEVAIKRHAEACVSRDFTIQPLYVRLEELNAALPPPWDKSEDARVQQRFVDALMAMLVRVTKEEGLTQVVMTTSDHAFQQVVKDHWGGGHAEVMCLGYMDKAATLDFLTSEGVKDEEMQELIWRTCGGSFPHLNSATNFLQTGHGLASLKEKLDGAMNQAVGVVKSKLRDTDLDKKAVDAVMGPIATHGFVDINDVPKDVFAKLIEANAVSYRQPCDIKAFALDLPKAARGIECVTAFNPREAAALQRIYGIHE